jgi:hypothetical protein
LGFLLLTFVSFVVASNDITRAVGEVKVFGTIILSDLTWLGRNRLITFQWKTVRRLEDTRGEVGWVRAVERSVSADSISDITGSNETRKKFLTNTILRNGITTAFSFITSRITTSRSRGTTILLEGLTDRFSIFNSARNRVTDISGGWAEWSNNTICIGTNACTGGSEAKIIRKTTICDVGAITGSS